MPGRRILAALEPPDSEADLEDPRHRRELRRKHGLILLVIAAGGVLGALARYQLGRWWPTAPPAFPWTTMIINFSGCLVIGSFMVIVTERWSSRPLVRPFFGTGVLGGYTTFSAYAVDVVQLTRLGHPTAAALYLIGTPVGAFLAAAIGIITTRRLLAGRGNQ